MTGTDGGENRELFTALRSAWEDVDPVPAGLAERMIAAVAVDDLNREFQLLTLVEGVEVAVRGEDGNRTVQFEGDGTEVLLHLAAPQSGVVRVDGWSRPAVLAARLAQEDEEWSAQTVGDGRFAFDHVRRGRSRVRMVVQQNEAMREFTTPWFDI